MIVFAAAHMTCTTACFLTLSTSCFWYVGGHKGSHVPPLMFIAGGYLSLTFVRCDPALLRFPPYEKTPRFDCIICYMAISSSIILRLDVLTVATDDGQSTFSRAPYQLRLVETEEKNYL